ncbi:MAG: type II toxin-antitoxin system antitoxin SocA domain-containing protein [Rikenellaceae bacterium]
MKTNALSIANYFVDKVMEGDGDLTLLRLVKYVYISYGLTLAILDKNILDCRYDKVEAWKFGPVIPSVYHSFKHNGNSQIRNKVQIPTDLDMESLSNINFVDAVINERDKQSLTPILDFVWDQYKDVPTPKLIDILHRDGTPWKFCYKPGANVDIPEDMTKAYYKAFINQL